MNLQVIHYVILFLGFVAAASGYVGGALPQYAAICHAVAGLCGSFAATLGVLSPGALGTPAPAPAPAPAAKAGPVATAVATADAANVAALQASK